MKLYDIGGSWRVSIEEGQEQSVMLPGTLDENGIGYPDTGSNQWHPDIAINSRLAEDKQVITSRFTRKHTFEGEAVFKRKIPYQPDADKRVFVEVERARCLKLICNGTEIPCAMPSTISTPYIFEVTGKIEKENEFVFLSDNRYQGMPVEAIKASSAVTDETQTNWNGLLGYVRIREEEGLFLSRIAVYPLEDTLTVQTTIAANHPWKGVLRIESDALAEPVLFETEVPAGDTQLTIAKLPFTENVKLWDEGEGNLYQLSVTPEGYEEKKVTFGVRTFGDNGRGRLALNGRTVFLRSEANCAEFPEAGHPPMTVPEWIQVLLRYQSYGINCMRFHSHCPPEAAFIAADRMGMLMQPELSHWDPKEAFESEESIQYYRTELEQILLCYANHPSFVMLTFGNELHCGTLGHLHMNELLRRAHEMDATRIFANGSNVHYGAIGCDPESDFYTSQKYYEQFLRGTSADMEGHINRKYPDAATNYNETMKELRKQYQKPVFSFEVGQFEILPDFGELQQFYGISRPDNLELICKRAKEKGFWPLWEKMVAATGELARIGYREEIEAAMRTTEMSGISLLGLQDFPGQGTALVGMMNSHLEPKPYAFADPEKFKAFFTDQLPLVLLPKYTYQNTETLTAKIQIANFGKQEISGELRVILEEAGNKQKETKQIVAPVGELSTVGSLSIPLLEILKPTRLNLTVEVAHIRNTYPIWVYPEERVSCPEMVYETTWMDERAMQTLEEGGVVYLAPPSTKDAMPGSIQGQFTTDFWSVGTFATQEGGMGQLIAQEHPIFREFPTEYHTNWQWWVMAGKRAVILPKLYDSIIMEMDSYAYLRPMTQLLECRCLRGRLLFSTLGLQDSLQYPECRALQNAVYRYLVSDQFQPTQELAPELFKGLVRNGD